jgi:isoleucyl-tRNA synthetase
VAAAAPGGYARRLHLALFPKPEVADEATLARWSALIDARDAVLKPLEEARAAKQIASGLEAQVRLTAPPAMMAALRAYEAQSRVFPGNLASLFIVSHVELAAGETLSAEVRRADGGKCERCWTYSTGVGEQKAHPGVCPRCAAVLEARS